MRATIRIILISAVALVALVLAGLFVLPFPKNADAITLCVPVLGPVQRFNERASPEERRITRIHEAVHARQCLDEGAAKYLLASLNDAARITHEAQAYCAEVLDVRRRGAESGPAVRFAIAALSLGYRNRSLDTSRVREIFLKVCPSAAQ